MAIHRDPEETESVEPRRSIQASQRLPSISAQNHETLLENGSGATGTCRHIVKAFFLCKCTEHVLEHILILFSRILSTGTENMGCSDGIPDPWLVGGMFACAPVYSITQADIDAGEVSNIVRYEA